MTGDPSWFPTTHTAAVSRREPRALSWAERFRGALLGGAVGDALGAGVRTRTAWDIQHWFGRGGVADYLPVFGRRGGATELTQLTAFTLEALLRARAVNGGSADWLPTPVVRTNHLRWLHTQGVPWEFAMSGHLQTHPEPSGWLLERPELFSTRNPGGGALAALGRLATQPPTQAAYDPGRGPAVRPGFADCAVWAAPMMVWSTSEDRVFAAAADVARLLTDDLNVHGATGLHADVLAQLIQGDIGLWDAVGLADARLSALGGPAGTPGAVRRAVHAAMFATRGGRRPQPPELDAEFDTEQQPGELGTALAAVAATSTFPDAVLMAVNVSADSSVTGALAGQLAGALHGPEAIPPRWREELELGEVLETLCADAAEAFAPPPPPPPLPKWAQRYVGEPGRAAPRELGPAADRGRPGAGSNDETMVIDLRAVEQESGVDTARTPVPGAGEPFAPEGARSPEAPRSAEALHSPEAPHAPEPPYAPDQARGARGAEPWGAEPMRGPESAQRGGDPRADALDPDTLRGVDVRRAQERSDAGFGPEAAHGEPPVSRARPEPPDPRDLAAANRPGAEPPISGEPHVSAGQEGHDAQPAGGFGAEPGAADRYADAPVAEPHERFAGEPSVSPDQAEASRFAPVDPAHGGESGRFAVERGSDRAAESARTPLPEADAAGRFAAESVHETGHVAEPGHFAEEPAHAAEDERSPGEAHSAEPDAGEPGRFAADPADFRERGSERFAGESSAEAPRGADVASPAEPLSSELPRRQERRPEGSGPFAGESASAADWFGTHGGSDPASRFGAEAPGAQRRAEEGGHFDASGRAAEDGPELPGDRSGFGGDDSISAEQPGIPEFAGASYDFAPGRAGSAHDAPAESDAAEADAAGPAHDASGSAQAAGPWSEPWNSVPQETGSEGHEGSRRSRKARRRSRSAEAVEIAGLAQVGGVQDTQENSRTASPDAEHDTSGAGHGADSADRRESAVEARTERVDTARSGAETAQDSADDSGTERLRTADRQDTFAQRTDRTELAELGLDRAAAAAADADRPSPVSSPDGGIFGLSPEPTDREELSRLAKLVSLRPEEAGRIPVEDRTGRSRGERGGAEPGGADQDGPEGGGADQGGPEPFSTEPFSTDSVGTEPDRAEQDGSERGASEQDSADQGGVAPGSFDQDSADHAAPAQRRAEQNGVDQGRTAAQSNAPRDESEQDGSRPDSDRPEGAQPEGARPEGASPDSVQPEGAPPGSSAQDLPERNHSDQARSAQAHTTDGAPSTEPRAAKSSGGHAKPEATDEVAPSLTERVLGCFLGGALGDALGADLEFATAAEITDRFGAAGPQGLREAYGVQGAITDDTQLTLFTAEGLIRGSVARRTLGTGDPMPEVQLAYQRWLHTQGVEWPRAAGPFLPQYPEPDGWLVEVPGLFHARGAGKTVFRALTAFGEGGPAGSIAEPINDSKACGGTMRAAPVALYSPDPPVAFELAARVAALTHGHPSGYLSAGALAVIVQQALLGQTLDDGVWLALQVLETWDGHEETSELLKRAVELAEQGTPTPQQIAEHLGGGWVGEQALAIAVCAALAGEDVPDALRIAVHHDGDSDSTGAICGNIVGALTGVSGLPVSWLADLELRDVAEQIALDCVAEFGEVLLTDPDSPEPASERPADEEWDERYPVRDLMVAGHGDPPTALLPAVQDEAEPEPPGPSPEPLAAFPAPKPAPRRISGPQPAYDSES